MEQKNTNRARVKVAVFFVLAVHAIGLMALLMQGCRKEDPVAQQANDTNSVATASPAATNTVPEATLPAAPVLPGVGTAAATSPAATDNAATSAAPPGAASDYTVVQGDNFWTIGKKFSVTSKAIADANPGVDPAKLKIGQKLHIPASVAKATTGPSTSMVADASSGDQLYTVKSGDNLLKIAGQYHTTVKAIRSANSLSTDRITVGQKLKIPKGAAATAPTTTTAAIPAAPESAAAITSAAPVGLR
jgi:LysM repeat protein